MIRAVLASLALSTASSSASDWLHAAAVVTHGHGSGNEPRYPIHPRLISQSVYLKDLPAKIIKITRTVAVKVPVPYPVKVPHHIPIPVPVNRPIPVPVPHYVKVDHHVPVPVARPVAIPIPHQVPVYISRPVAVPHPVQVSKPIYLPSLLHQDHHHHNHHLEQQQPHPHDSLFAKSSDFETQESETNQSFAENDSSNDDHANYQQTTAESQNYDYFLPSSLNNQQDITASQNYSPRDSSFRPSQPDYDTNDEA
uniref:Uncharacterized protein n=1 Tax=Trichogramma kaykai TaxID=54128 RepID=A0ABD2WCK8_9HYME